MTEPHPDAAQLDPAHPDVSRSPLLEFLLRLPLRKVTTWAAFIGVLILLRDFFPLIFMTFVLSFVATSVVAKVEHRFTKRWIPIVIFYALIVTGVVGLVLVAVPKLTAQVREITQDIKVKGGMNAWMDAKLRDGLGAESYDRIATELSSTQIVTDDGVSHAESASVSGYILEHYVSEERKADAFARVGAFGKGVWTGVVYVFLTIVFSLMLVWGLPGFKKGLQRLETSRIADMYLEVAPSIAQFGRLLGRAFEAQTMIAGVNTVITFVGMKLIGIPGAFALSIPVFLCSFIPVAGVFISTAPIALVGLFMAGGGVGKLASVVVMVCVAHVIEAYILNPRIYGAHMKMNPLAVLMILLIAEHSVGVWGLVIAIPLSTYVWRHVILGEADVPAPVKP